MRTPALPSCGILLAIFLAGCSSHQETQGASARTVAASSSPVWKHHCTVAGIPPGDDDNKAYLQRIANECSPLDACMLACARSGCAYGVGGGCAHVCGGMGTDDPAKDADAYEAKTAFFCRWRRPNSAFKPNSFRYTNSVAERACHAICSATRVGLT